jgi:hypothetical protein
MSLGISSSFHPVDLLCYLYPWHHQRSMDQVKQKTKTADSPVYNEEQMKRAVEYINGVIQIIER